MRGSPKLYKKKREKSKARNVEDGDQTESPKMKE